jgi:hypothetical protein
MFRQRSIGARPAGVHHSGMPQPPIKRYALVPSSRDGGVQRFHLARVATPSRALGDAGRLERMERVAALSQAHEEGARPPGERPPG